MLVAMRDAFCGVFAFLFENKRYRGKKRKTKWERRRCRSVRREEKKRGGRKEGKWKARRTRTYLRGQRKVHCEMRMQRHARRAAL